MARPMSSVNAAGYSSFGDSASAAAAGRKSGAGDPLNDNFGSNIGIRRADPLKKRSENSPEELANEMERDVHALIEQSACAIVAGDHSGALDSAKMAMKKERALTKFKEERSLGEQNVDLTFCVQFSLARAYHANSMYTEALETYNSIVKNK
jgi:intraflagellar transport protein 88